MLSMITRFLLWSAFPYSRSKSTSNLSVYFLSILNIRFASVLQNQIDLTLRSVFPLTIYDYSVPMMNFTQAIKKYIGPEL